MFIHISFSFDNHCHKDWWPRWCHDFIYWCNGLTLKEETQWTSKEKTYGMTIKILNEVIITAFTCIKCWGDVLKFEQSYRVCRHFTKTSKVTFMFSLLFSIEFSFDRLLSGFSGILSVKIVVMPIWRIMCSSQGNTTGQVLVGLTLFTQSWGVRQIRIEVVFRFWHCEGRRRRPVDHS